MTFRLRVMNIREIVLQKGMERISDLVMTDTHFRHSIQSFQRERLETIIRETHEEYIRINRHLESE